MAAQGSCPSGGCSWQDILPELLSLVFLRMPSHADRVRLRAVCRSWRSGARLQPPPPPPLPWIVLCDGSLLSLPDGRVYDLPFPADALYHVCTGDMFFFVHRDESCSLMDPCSGVTTPQHVDPGVLRQQSPISWHPSTDKTPLYYLPRTILKVVVSDRIVAVQFSLFGVSISPRGPKRAGSCSAIEWVRSPGSSIKDIAFFQGKLYVLGTSSTGHQTVLYRELYVMDFGPDQVIMPDIKPVHCIHGTPRVASKGMLHQYLVVSGDRLLMVEKQVDMTRYGNPIRTGRLAVFEARGLGGGDGRWREVDTLMGNALFVSSECSASLPVDRHRGAQEDCIYYTSDYNLTWSKKTNSECDFLNSGMYDMRNQRLMLLPIATTPIETVVASHGGRGSQSWLFVSPNGVKEQQHPALIAGASAAMSCPLARHHFPFPFPFPGL